MRFHITIITITILLFANRISAQDFHLSQYDANPLYLNPALTGLHLNENWDYRFNLNYREQRGNLLGRSNKIIASGFDAPLNNKFSIGEFIFNNKSINGSLNTLNIMISGAYKITHKDHDGNDRHNISVGLQLGLLQKSFNTENFVFDSQYSSASTNGFDDNLPNGENFIKQNTSQFDVNMGAYYRYINHNKKYSPYGGFSIYHLSQPNQAFTNIHSQTPMRFTLHAGCFYTLSEQFSIQPQFLYLNQANTNELNIGIMAYDKIRCTDYQPMLGFSWRNKDAVIIHVGLKYKTYSVRVSYDIATNYLKQYGNRGLEMSIIYTPRKKKNEPELIATLVPLHTDSLASKNDTAQSFRQTPIPINNSAPPIITKPTIIIVHDTIFVPVKTTIHDTLKITDTVITKMPEAPTKPQIKDPTVIPLKLMVVKPLASKDSSVIKDTNRIQMKSLTYSSFEKKDTTQSISSKKTKTPLATDSPYELFQKSHPPVAQELKENPLYVIPKVNLNPAYSTVNKSFRVQLGAFKEDVPLDIANKLLAVKAEEIKNQKDSIGYTIFSVGDFKTHDEAIPLRDKMMSEGFPDAFIIAVAPGTFVVPMQKMQAIPSRLEEETKSYIPIIPVFPAASDSLFDVFHKNSLPPR